jgi:hypothetical protein
MDSYRSELVSQSVHDALDSLSEMHRQVLTLRYLGDMNSFEIARFVGVSPAAVRRRLVNARAALKAEMLDTMSEVFEEQRFQAIFTLRIAEIVKHIRVQPLPRDTIISWGLSLAAGLLLTILGLGTLTNLFFPAGHHTFPAVSEATGATGPGEILVDILKEGIVESGGETDMLKNSRISAFAATVAVISVLSSGTMAEF